MRTAQHNASVSFSLIHRSFSYFDAGDRIIKHLTSKTKNSSLYLFLASNALRADKRDNVIKRL